LKCRAGTVTVDSGHNACKPCNNGTFADQDGLPFCIRCGTGTSSLPSGTSCYFDCSNVILEDQNGTTLAGVYDISQLGTWNVSYVQAVNTTAVEFNAWGSICEWNPSCIDDFSGLPQNTYICLRDASHEYMEEIGKIVSIVPRENGKQGLQLQYASWSSECLTNLELICDPSVGISGPIVKQPFDYFNYITNCQLNLTWNTIYACPQCTEGNIKYFDSQCDNGMQTRRYYFVNSFCFGGAELPASVQLPCANQLSVKVEIAIIAVVVGFIVLVAGAGTISYLYFKNKKLYKEYSRLKESNIPLDEKEADDFVALDENKESNHK